MYVLHYELISDTRQELPPVYANAVASLNTHDMPPFAGFWEGADIPQRLKLGLLDKDRAQGEKRARRQIRQVTNKSLRQQGWLNNAPTDATSVIKGCLSYLAASQAPVVLVNLEDLWGETEPQNVPGTGDRYPSWRRKARYSFDEFRRMPGVANILRTVNEIREKTWARKRNRRQ
jgi:4-alpha-glucanotransferase